MRGGRRHRGRRSQRQRVPATQRVELAYRGGEQHAGQQKVYVHQRSEPGGGVRGGQKRSPVEEVHASRVHQCGDRREDQPRQRARVQDREDQPTSRSPHSTQRERARTSQHDEQGRDHPDDGMSAHVHHEFAARQWDRRGHHQTHPRGHGAPVPQARPRDALAAQPVGGQDIRADAGPDREDGQQLQDGESTGGVDVRLHQILSWPRDGPASGRDTAAPRRRPAGGRRPRSTSSRRRADPRRSGSGAVP